MGTHDDCKYLTNCSRHIWIMLSLCAPTQKSLEDYFFATPSVTVSCCCYCHEDSFRQRLYDGGSKKRETPSSSFLVVWHRFCSFARHPGKAAVHCANLTIWQALKLKTSAWDLVKKLEIIHSNVFSRCSFKVMLQLWGLGHSVFFSETWSKLMTSLT